MRAVYERITRSEPNFIENCRRPGSAPEHVCVAHITEQGSWHYRTVHDANAAFWLELNCGPFGTTGVKTSKLTCVRARVDRQKGTGGWVSEMDGLFNKVKRGRRWRSHKRQLTQSIINRKSPRHRRRTNFCFCIAPSRTMSVLVSKRWSKEARPGRGHL